MPRLEEHEMEEAFIPGSHPSRRKKPAVGRVEKTPTGTRQSTRIKTASIIKKAAAGAQANPSTRGTRQSAVKAQVRFEDQNRVFLDVARFDTRLKKGASISRTNVNLVRPGEVGEVVNWPASNAKKWKKILSSPLAKQFDDSRASYGEGLEAVIQADLNAAYSTACGQLDEVEARDEEMINNAIELMNSTPNERHFGEETITITTKSPGGQLKQQVFTIDERMQDFKKTLRASEHTITALSQQHEAVLAEIADFVAKKLKPQAKKSGAQLDDKTKQLIEELEAKIANLGVEEMQELEADIRDEKAKMRQMEEMMSRFM